MYKYSIYLPSYMIGTNDFFKSFLLLFYGWAVPIRLGQAIICIKVYHHFSLSVCLSIFGTTLESLRKKLIFLPKTKQSSRGPSSGPDNCGKVWHLKTISLGELTFQWFNLPKTIQRNSIWYWRQNNFKRGRGMLIADCGSHDARQHRLSCFGLKFLDFLTIAHSWQSQN